ncbi:MAG: hypothetical protein ACRCYL_18720 [Kluyvera sp.]
MRNRPLLGKWFLIVTCLAMALCLAQRAVYLHHFLQQAGQTTQVVTQPTADDAAHGPSPCQLSANSLFCAQPIFFDGALPAVIIFLALLQLFTPLRRAAFRDEVVRPPRLKIHLQNCVFRE